MPRLRTSLRSWILAGIAACHGNRAGKGGFKVHPRGHDPGAGADRVRGAHRVRIASGSARRNGLVTQSSMPTDRQRTRLSAIVSAIVSGTTGT